VRCGGVARYCLADVLLGAREGPAQRAAVTVGKTMTQDARTPPDIAARTTELDAIEARLAEVFPQFTHPTTAGRRGAAAHLYRAGWRAAMEPAEARPMLTALRQREDVERQQTQTDFITQWNAITWTCDPPEFAVYVSRVDVVDLGPDALMIEVDMRCKRVPTGSRERTRWTDETGDEALGVLDIRFSTGVVTARDGAPMRLDYPEDHIVWPSRLGEWTRPQPTLSVHHGRVGHFVEFSNQGRYTTRVLLMRRGVPRTDVLPGDAATLAAHEHGATHGREPVTP
jgi:hypothetical protein